MKVIYIVLGIILYLFIGCVFAGIINDEDLDAAAIFFWPPLVIVFLSVLVLSALKEVGYTIADIFKHFIRGGEQNNEKE